MLGVTDPFLVTTSLISLLTVNLRHPYALLFVRAGFIWLCGPLLGPLIQPSDAWPPSGNPGLGSRRHLANRVTFGCKT